MRGSERGTFSVEEGSGSTSGAVSSYGWVALAEVGRVAALTSVDAGPSVFGIDGRVAEVLEGTELGSGFRLSAEDEAVGLAVVVTATDSCFICCAAFGSGERGAGVTMTEVTVEVNVGCTADAAPVMPGVGVVAIVHANPETPATASNKQPNANFFKSQTSQTLYSLSAQY